MCKREREKWMLPLKVAKAAARLFHFVKVDFLHFSLSLFLLSQAYFEMLSIGVENTFSRSKRRTKFSVARDIKNNFDKTFFSLILSGPDVT